MLYRFTAIRVGLYATAVVLAVALLCPLTSGTLIHTRAAGLSLLGLGVLTIVLTAALAVALGLFAPRRLWGDDQQIARWIGVRRPPMASDLLSCVELTHDSVAAPTTAEHLRGAPSAVLVDALLYTTAAHVARLDPQRLLPPRAIRRATTLVCGLVLANATAAIAIPHVLARGWRLMLVAPAHPYGTAKLSEVPLVGDLEVTVTFPEYTHRAPTVTPSSSGEVRAMRGSMVSLKTSALSPVTTAELMLEAAPSSKPEAKRDPIAMPASTPLTVDKTSLTGNFEVSGPLHYRFALTDAQHHRTVEERGRAVEIEPDAVPTVQLLAPAAMLDVTTMKRIELGYIADDDFGLSHAELVWRTGPATTSGTATPSGAPETNHRVLSLGQTGDTTIHTHVENKFVWDLADVPLPPGAEVHYWVEVHDNDAVDGPQLGRSQEFALHVFSPRERHEQNLQRHEQIAEKILHLLGDRLPGLGDDLTARRDLGRQATDLVVELGTLGAAYEKDAQAADALKKQVDTMRGKLDKANIADEKVLDHLGKQAKPTKGIGARFVATDQKLVTELEDGAILMADWLERQRVEGMLAVSDEIAGHQKRLRELMADFARTGDPKLKDAIARELRALQQGLTELANKRGGLPEDVLDRFVHQDAATDHGAASCFAEVQHLLDEGKTAAAQTKLAQCSSNVDQAVAGMESALSSLRGDKFGDEQKKFDEVMNELSDIGKDQDDIAAESDRIFDRYAQQADALARQHGKEAAHRVGSIVERLKHRLEDIPPAGLTPFATEELDIAKRRLDDVSRMIEGGDLAEALAMAKQTKASLDTIASELEAALDDDPKSRWASDTTSALDGIEHAHPAADELIQQLEKLAPSPEQILDDADKQSLDRLRRRQAQNQQRAQALGSKSQSASGEMPGDSGQELGKRLGTASDSMGAAQQHMKGNDPGGARQSARAAADALKQAKQQAQGAARQQQAGSTPGGDEPIRIPGANEYRAPEQFRQDIMEAMKRKAPDGYSEQLRHYYEELIR